MTPYFEGKFLPIEGKKVALVINRMLKYQRKI